MRTALAVLGVVAFLVVAGDGEEPTEEPAGNETDTGDETEQAPSNETNTGNNSRSIAPPYPPPGELVE